MLGKASPRLPWVLSGEATEQRQLLERIRHYLFSIEESNLNDAVLPDRVRPNLALAVHDIQAPVSSNLGARQQNDQQEAAQQILQAVMQEMGSFRDQVVQPLQVDVQALHQQRKHCCKRSVN